jgi:hypothetical protein
MKKKNIAVQRPIKIFLLELHFMFSVTVLPINVIVRRISKDIALTFVFTHSTNEEMTKIIRMKLKIAPHLNTVGTESIRTAERISRENAFFKTLPKIEFSVEFNKFFFEG